jgi:Arylsulfatase A and related enzymes
MVRRMSRAPDILWIVTTQWRAQACGYAGDPNARTPALDAFAADPRTVNYAQAVTPHPFGPFARAAMLTGVSSPENGVRDYWDALPRDARTIAHVLAERGYETAFFGKWGVGERDRSAPLVGEAAARVVVPPEARGGFAHWVGFEGGFLLNDPWLHGDGVEGFERARGYQSDVVCELAARWLARASSAPRFVVASLEAPHPPYDAPTPAGVRRLRPEEVVVPANVPLGGEVEAKARRELAGYYAHIAATDASIGRLLARVPDGTIVVVTSVHGDMHGAHGLFRKGWPHEESVRVPLLVRGGRGQGARSGERGVGGSDEPVSLLDLPAMTLAWSERRDWVCPREHAEISMPCVVALPYQCDRVWRGRRSATEKRVFNADGSEWGLGE